MSTSTTTVAIKTTLVAMIAFLVIVGTVNQATAIEYGGIGGRPAYPRDDVPRSSSIFIHTLEPGASKTDGIQVINNTSQSKSLIIYAADSVPSTDGGFACRQRSEPRSKAGAWIELERGEVTLPARENKIVPFTITLPQTADVGEHNACILVQEKKADDGGSGSGVSLSFRTGIRVAITVPGELVRELSITDLILKDRGNGQIDLSPIITNTGNVSVDANAVINVRSVFGSNPPKLESTFSILREDTARWNFKLPTSHWGGWYKATLTVTYEDSSGERIILAGPTVSFFASPQGVAVVVYLFIVFALSLALVMAFMLRRRARWIKNTWRLCPVREEDTLAGLAKKHGVPWKLIAKVNGIKPPYNIDAEEIKLPPLNGRSPSGRPKSPPERQPGRESERLTRKMTKSPPGKTTERSPKLVTREKAKKRPPQRRI